MSSLGRTLSSKVVGKRKVRCNQGGSVDKVSMWRIILMYPIADADSATVLCVDARASVIGGWWFWLGA